MGNNVRSKFWTFHNANLTVPSTGNEMYISAGDVTMNLTFSGTATSFTAIVEGRANDDEIFYPITCANTNGYILASSITVPNSVWQVSLDGWVKVRVRVTALLGGNLNVKGTIVN